MASKDLLNITDPSLRQPPPGQVRSYPSPTKTGKIPFSIPSHNESSETWYALYGNLSPSTVPLIVLHGGPGCGHNYLKTLSLLSTGPLARPVILYDQIGCGNSTRFRSRRQDNSFWHPSLFIDELNNLVSALGITTFDLLGQSWGGMLGAQYATLRPKGLRKLVICDSPADMGTWVAVANQMRGLLPKEVQETLMRCEEAGETDGEEYEKAVVEFYKWYVCRVVEPFPEEFLETDRNVKEDDTVYYTMNGPSEFHVIGNLKTWDIRPELHKIEVPTLLVNGKFDEAQDVTMAPYFEKIRSPVKWVRFAESSHMPHLEETEDFMIAVSNFLAEG
ncbi:alpha/beta hydrolase fold-containing protein 18 [Elsinoe australis]|uniref:Alpha/beta hydrolase fold-containing protein 18 n=1 Tax=Elsinoe australis TaxID=40998 RepID=A0A4U7B6V8_9PEZI|nr:alpha/beta hydrolase fold-containing protein 18 [Elsinoe australis]